MAEMLEAAMAYVELGLAVIPLRGKIPMFSNWPEIASKDRQTVERWWKQSPDANIGIATGRKSNIFVVDIDPRHGGQESWEHELAMNSALPDTWQDITGGGGIHIYFRYPNFSVKSGAGLFPGVDIRGDGGQVVAPPSIHPETKRTYEWDGARPIQEQPLAEAPLWLLNKLEPKAAPKPLSEIPLKIPHGVQHYTLLSLAGTLRRLGLTSEEILPTVSMVNERRCEKPGPQKNIDQIVKSVMKYAPGDRNLLTTANKLWMMTRAKEHKNEEQLLGMRPVDAFTLMKRPTPETSMVIDGCLHNGCTILAGKPKSGKSWLTLGMAISVATGGVFIGVRDILKPGRVAYWALEESETRTQKRLGALVEHPIISLQNIEFMYALKPMFSGGLEDISAYCERARPDVVIIDTLMAFVTGDHVSRRDVFRDDYREIKALGDLAARHDTAVVVVHHTNKLGGSGVSAVAGSHGVTAAADCIWIMDRQPQRRALLEITGREIEDQSFLIELDVKGGVGWHAVEQGEDAVLSGERQVILEVLRECGPKTPKQLSVEIGKTPMATRQLLCRMIQRGLLIRDQTGTYRISYEANRVWNERDRD